MEGTAWDARHEPPPREATRAAQTAGVYDCCRWGGASVKGCPWLFLGDPQELKAESGLVSMGHCLGVGQGVRPPWVEARAMG